MIKFRIELRKLNSSLYFLFGVLFCLYLSLKYSSKQFVKKKIEIGQKIIEYNNDVENDKAKLISKIKSLQEQFHKIKDNKLIDRSVELLHIRKIIDEIDIRILNYTTKNEMNLLKKQLEREETINTYFILFNKSISEHKFKNAYRFAKILYAITKRKEFLMKIKDEKLIIYKKLADKEFSKNNYTAAKNFYTMYFTLNPTEEVKEKILTINNILALRTQDIEIARIERLIQKAKIYESSYKILHSYYILKHVQKMGQTKYELRNIINTLAKKWQETKQIAKNFMKQVFTLIKKDNRQDLELAKKKLELAKKYFPYFYKYDAILNDINKKLRYAGMILIQGGVVEFFDPKTKKLISKKVNSFYIDKEYLKFGEYLEFLANTDKQKFETLRERLLSHKFKGNIAIQPLELISFNDIKKFAKHVNKRLPTIAELVRFCNYIIENNTIDNNLKKLSILSKEIIHNKIVVAGYNYLMKDNIDKGCNVTFLVPKNMGILGVGVKLVKTVK